MKIVLCQPQTYMNNSGLCVAPLVSWYKIPHDHLLVIYDDIDLAPGQLRLRKSGSAGTHNGMRSILSCLPDGDFPRLRVGIGTPPEEWDLIHWVLGRAVSEEERIFMNSALLRAADVVEDLLGHGMDHAMQMCNRKQSN